MQKRRIAIAVDLSRESAFAVQWAVENYLRPGDSVVLLHVSRTPVLYGADWGSGELHQPQNEEEEEKDHGMPSKALDASKVQELAAPLVRAKVPFKVHIVRDHDMKERLCLEMERLGPSAAIMGSRGIGASSSSSSREGLGSVSDYCVRHCICPVVVVRCPGERADPVVEMHSGSELEEEESEETHVVSPDGA